VLVGINTYNPNAAMRARFPHLDAAGALKRPQVAGDATYWAFENLDGPLNDVALIEGVLQGLGCDHFVKLTEGQATADAILTALQHNLVDDANAGDVRIFYYSGHGSHIRNIASQEHDEDQTIVPADNWRNVPDIRDKEIARILWRAARKGVRVTFIADSCYSGSLTRGKWNGRGKIRSTSGVRAGSAGKLVEPVSSDPGEIDPATGQPVDPEKAGVLTLAAAQQNEEARELPDENGDAHGAFTLALSRALKSRFEPMDRVFQRIQIEIRGRGLWQEPVMGGAGRAGRGIFGDEVDATAGITYAAESVTGNRVRLRGGPAVGLYPGCKLKRDGATGAARLTITNSIGAGSSEAQIVGNGIVKPGDLFVLDQWVTPARERLRVFLPAAAQAGRLLSTMREIGKLRNSESIEWILDAAEGEPTHVMSWNGSTWLLRRNPAGGIPANLGSEPSAESVRHRLPAHAKFLLVVPPTTDLAAAIRMGGAANSAVLVQRSGTKGGTPAGAHYWFEGRLHGNTIEYAWMLPDAREAKLRMEAGPAAGRGYFPLPVRSDWVALKEHHPDAAQTAGADLTGRALRLARIRGWYTLQSPPAQTAFPYHLALKNVATEKFYAGGDMTVGEQYKFYLRADPEELKRSQAWTLRWVYIFVVDHLGQGSLLFPQKGHGNEANRLPYAMPDEKPVFERLIPVSRDRNFDFMVQDPGIDTCFLLTTEDPIDNPEVLDFEGVASESGSRGPGSVKNPLTDLLESVSSASRGKPRTVPARWSIESITVRSVPKEK
jgi:hypothetical protein